MFVDHIRIFAKAGDGGSGALSFRREKYVPKGGPDGGDGGRGGDVVLLVDPNTDNLRSFFYDPKLVAEKAKAGAGARKTGRSGRKVVGRVPPGTLVYRCAGESVHEAAELERSGEAEPELLADLTEAGEELVLCRGGDGGRGNWSFRSATNQVPREYEPGEEGERGVFFLELRRIADVGLVGFPNAGKSTLLGKLSAAKPKVAAYPFTTMQPKVGVVEFPGFRRCTVADIPGLIEGAHANRGLGHEFLRHIMRCRVLMFVVDMAGFEGRDPIADLEILRREVKEYDKDLAAYPWVVAANKMDIEGAEEKLTAFRLRFPKVEVFPISAERGDGLEELRAMLDDRYGCKGGH
jgi:GTP-binding protein